MKKNKVGRPRKIESVDDMQKVIDAYFQECDENEIPYTVAGLAYVLDMTTHSLMNYQKADGYEQFFSTIKKAKQKIESNMMARALANKVNPAVAIFLSKANFGYTDQPKDTNTDRKIIIEFENDNDDDDE